MPETFSPWQATLQQTERCGRVEYANFATFACSEKKSHISHVKETAIYFIHRQQRSMVNTVGCWEINFRMRCPTRWAIMAMHFTISLDYMQVSKPKKIWLELTCINISQKPGKFHSCCLLLWRSLKLLFFFDVR